MTYIGMNIRKERIKAGFDQMRLARALELDQTAISRFENGSRRPSVELLKKIAAALGCSFAALVNEGQDESGAENKKDEPAKNEDDYENEKEKNFVQALLAQNPEISVHLRSLAGRSGEFAPEDWQFLADHLMHAFAQVEMLLDRGNKK